MPALHSHKVRLVGVDGQEQPVLFDIETEGVHLLSKKAEVSPASLLSSALCPANQSTHIRNLTRLCVTFAQHLERFPFEVIVKWLPSTLRSQNAGTADCFDIQLKTPKGPRELRVKTDSERQAKKILKQLEATVQDLVDKRKALAAKQQKLIGQHGASSDAELPQAKKPVQSATLQHAAPSDAFSIQPSLLVSEAGHLERRPSGFTRASQHNVYAAATASAAAAAAAAVSLSCSCKAVVTDI